MQDGQSTILVVDDDPALRELLQYLLTGEGYRVECLADGTTALARIQVGGISLVLIDLRLLELDGLE